MKAKIEDTDSGQGSEYTRKQTSKQNKTKVLYFDLISVLLSELYNSLANQNAKL